MTNKNKMFDNVFNYIEKMLADGVMEINRLIDGIVIDKGVISCLKHSYFPLDKLKNIIDKNLRIYRNHSDQDRNIANIKEMEKKIIFGCGRILTPALILYKFDSTDDIFEEGKQISGKITKLNDLNDLNKLLRKKLQIDYAGALNEGSKVEIWRDKLISKIEKYKNNELIQANFLIESIKNLSENFRNIRKIKEMIEDKEVELAYRNLDEIKKMTVDELLETINEIYEELSKKDVAEAYGIIAYFHRCITGLYENENINEEKLKNIILSTEKTHRMIIDNYASKYDEMRHIYIGLVISKLKDRYEKKKNTEGAGSNA